MIAFFLDQITKLVDERRLTEDVMHLDFSKAFDIDPHKTLLEKLIWTALDMSINNIVD